MSQTLLIFLGFVAWVHADDVYPFPVGTAVSQTPGLRLDKNLTFTVSCTATNSTYSGTMTLVPVSAKGSFVSGNSTSTRSNTTKLYTTTLEANVTVMSHDNDTYTCNIVYNDKGKTANKSAVVDLLNKGTGVDLSLPTTPGEIGKPVTLKANFDKSVLNPGDNPQRVVWLHNGDLMYAYDKETGENQTTPRFKNRITSFSVAADFTSSEIVLTISNCDQNAQIGCMLTSHQSQAGMDSKTMSTVKPSLTNPIIKWSQSTVPANDTSWKTTLTCLVTKSTSSPELSILTPVNVTHGMPTGHSDMDSDTCLYDATLTEDISIPYGGSSSITCVANYTSMKTTLNETVDFWNLLSYPAPKIQPVEKGFTTDENWTFQFQCSTSNTTTGVDIKLVPMDVTGNHTDPVVQSSYEPGTNLLVTTLYSNVTVLPGSKEHICDKYRCDATYSDSERTKVKGDYQNFCNAGTGVTVTQVSGAAEPGARVRFDANINIAFLQPGNHASFFTWLLNNQSMCTYNVSTQKESIDSKFTNIVQSCGAAEDLKSGYVELNCSNCYREAVVSCAILFLDAEKGAEQTTFQVTPVMKSPEQVPKPYKVQENVTWNFLFECDVTGASESVTNITLVTSDTYQKDEHFTASYDNDTCLFGGKFTANVSIPYSKCAKYQCKVKYHSNKTVEDSLTEYCNNITYPKPVAEHLVSPLRTTANWTFTFTCSANSTHNNGTLSLDSSKAKGRHSNATQTSTQDALKLYTNKLTAIVTVPAGVDGKVLCDSYSCNMKYDNYSTTVKGDPVQYCNNGTGVSITQNQTDVKVGDIPELRAEFDTEMIGTEEPVAVVWSYNSVPMYTFNKTTGKSTLSGNHSRQIIGYSTDELFHWSHIYFKVSACDIDAADISCQLITEDHTGMDSKQLQIKGTLNAPVMMATPNHTATEGIGWNFTFHCSVSNSTETPKLSLAKSEDHGNVSTHSAYDNDTCLYSGYLSTNVTVPYGKCDDFRCKAEYSHGSAYSKTVTYCNGATPEKKKWKKWELALIVVGAIVVVCAIVSVIVWVIKKRKSSSADERQRLINEPSVS